MKTTPNPAAPPNRRPRFPLGALAEFVYPCCATPAFPAAVGGPRRLLAPPMKNCAQISLVVAVLLACSACDFRKNAASVRLGIGEQHVVALPDSPKFLAEEVALSAARVTLDLDRLWRTNWTPVADGRTVAPDGRRDEFLARNAANPNRGVITFTNGAGIRFVSVELQTNLLFLQCSRSK